SRRWAEKRPGERPAAHPAGQVAQVTPTALYRRSARWDAESMDGRAGKVLAIAVAALVLLALGAVVGSVLRRRAVRPAGSPEPTRQAYVTAVCSRDLDAAASHLDPDGTCDLYVLGTAWVERDVRVVLRDVDVDGDRATVGVD